MLVLCFLVGFCYCFCFIFWRFAPETVWKNSFDVRSGFSGFVLSSLGFSPTSFVFFLRHKDQVVTGHPLTRTCLAGFFSFFVSRRFCLFRPVWPCVLLLGVFLGVPFWAPRGFGILLELMGLEFVRSPLLRPFSWDARRQGFSSSALFSFPLVFCGHTVSRCPSR